MPSARLYVGHLDEDDVARAREVGEHLAEGLGVAAGDEQVAGGERQALARGCALGDRLAQRLRPRAGAVGEGAGGVAPHERAVRRVAHEPDREQRRVGLAEGELDEALAQLILGEDVRLAHGAMIYAIAKGRAGPARGLAEPRLAAGRPFP